MKTMEPAKAQVWLLDPLSSFREAMDTQELSFGRVMEPNPALLWSRIFLQEAEEVTPPISLSSMALYTSPLTMMTMEMSFGEVTVLLQARFWSRTFGKMMTGVNLIT
jgi:hypothetical protein